MRHDYGNSVCDNSSWLSYRLYILCLNIRGLKRNLEAGEIVSQVLTVQKALDATDERITNCYNGYW